MTVVQEVSMSPIITDAVYITIDEIEPLLSKPAVSISETPEPKTTETSFYGFFLMVCSAFCISLLYIFVHVAEASYSVPPPSTVLVRSILASTVSFLYILCFLDLRHILSSLTWKQKGLVAARSLFVASGTGLMFRALQLLTVAEAITLLFLSPVYVMLFSATMAGEQLDSSDCLSIVLAFAGFSCITRPSLLFETVENMSDERLTGITCGVISAMLIAAALVTHKAIDFSIHYMVTINSLALGAMLLSATTGGATGLMMYVSKHNSDGLWYVIAAAAFAFVGQCFFNKGLHHCAPGSGILMQNMELPMVYVLGLLLLGQMPDLITCIGSGCVLVAAVTIGYRHIEKS